MVFARRVAAAGNQICAYTIVAAVVLVCFIYLLVRPNKYTGDNEVKIDVSKITANK